MTAAGLSAAPPLLDESGDRLVAVPGSNGGERCSLRVSIVRLHPLAADLRHKAIAEAGFRTHAGCERRESHEDSHQDESEVGQRLSRRRRLIPREKRP